MNTWHSSPVVGRGRAVNPLGLVPPVGATPTYATVGRVMQLVDMARSKRVFCKFESCRAHHELVC